MLLLKNLFLVMTIPLASHLLSTILIHRIAFLVFLSSCFMPEILGEYIQSIISQNKHLDLFMPMSLLPIVLYNTPRVLYINAKTDYKEVLKENKGKSGVYVWINKINGKQYVGSATDLGDKKLGL